MSRKNVLALLVFNAIINAFLINLQILKVTHLSWWLVFLPTWYSMILLATKILGDQLKNSKILRLFVNTNRTFKKD